MRSFFGRFITLAVASVFALSACGPSYPNCESDKHCKAKNEVCVDKICRQCRDDSQCAQLDPCMMCGGDNSCVARTGCCKSDLDCPRGRCWRSGSGVGTCGGACTDDDQCPAGQKCSGGACVPAISCMDDSACGPGQRCLDGDCVTATCEMQVIYFDFNEYAIRLDMEARVTANASCVQEIGLPHRLEGHCDERGSDEYNLALGQRRAGAVYRQYQELGVNPALISTLSYGEERPVCSGHDEDCWRQNRRVETVKQ